MKLEDIKLKHKELLSVCFDFSPSKGWLILVNTLLDKIKIYR